jgi:arylsulfatase A-like enzyme
VPLIVYDPSPEADATRGTVSDALVECIDFAPTFVDVAGGQVEGHVLEGHSLLPILRGEADEMPREVAICEYDFASTPLADKLGLGVREAIAFMVADKRWKLVHCEGGFRPILFDLENDPNEFNDLGDSADHTEIIEAMYEKLFAWARRPSQRTTRTHAQLLEMRKGGPRKRGVVIGVYDENDIPLELTVHYRGRKARDHRPSRQEPPAAE